MRYSQSGEMFHVKHFSGFSPLTENLHHHQSFQRTSITSGESLTKEFSCIHQQGMVLIVQGNAPGKMVHK
jgi:hypothetical protein